MNFTFIPTNIIVTQSVLNDAYKAHKAGLTSFDIEDVEGARLLVDVKEVLGCEAGDIVDAIRDSPSKVS